MRRWPLFGAVLAALVLVGGATYASAASNKQVAGQGTGTVVCFAGGPALPATIQFQADFSKGTASGFVQIFGGGIFKFGTVVGGSVSTHSYRINGNETFAQCPGAVFPTTYTIGQDCGANVTINFDAASGQRGVFIGNVACST